MPFLSLSNLYHCFWFMHALLIFLECKIHQENATAIYELFDCDDDEQKELKLRRATEFQKGTRCPIHALLLLSPSPVT